MRVQKFSFLLNSHCKIVSLCRVNQQVKGVHWGWNNLRQDANRFSMSYDKETYWKLQKLLSKFLWFLPKRWQPRDTTFGECRSNFFSPQKVMMNLSDIWFSIYLHTYTDLYNLVQCDPCIWIHITHGGKNTLQITADRRRLKYSPVKSHYWSLHNRC